MTSVIFIYFIWISIGKTAKTAHLAIVHPLDSIFHANFPPWPQESNSGDKYGRGMNNIFQAKIAYLAFLTP